MEKTFAATAILLGTIVGAGYLGMPYVVQKSGFLLGLLHLLLIGAAVMLSTLYLGRIAMKTRRHHHLTGYAALYLGLQGKRLMLLATLIGIISALVAYMLGEGISWSYLLTGSGDFTMQAALLFWFVLAMLTARGMRVFARIETLTVSAMLILMLTIIAFETPQVQLVNLATIHPENMMLPFGVILFSFLGFSAIPEMKLLLKSNKKGMQRSIVRAHVLALILYTLFTLAVVGTHGSAVPAIATLALGAPFIVLSFITLFTAYFALATALIDTLCFDLAMSRIKAWCITNGSSLALFLLLTALHEADFTLIISIGGILSGGITALLILAMLPKARVPYSPLLRLLLAALFIGGALAELVLLFA